MSRKLLPLISLMAWLFVKPLTCQAQERIAAYFQYQFAGTGIANEGYRQGIGGSLEYISPDLRRGHNLQLKLGAELSILEAGHESRRLRGTLAEESDVDRITVRNMQYSLLGKIRLQGPATWAVKPYADFIAGLGVFAVGEIDHFGVNLLSCENFPFCDSRNSRNMGSNWKLRTGIATGLSIELNEQLNLHFRGTYLYSGRIRYVNLESVEMGDFGPVYETGRTRINPWSFQIGIQSVL